MRETDCQVAVEQLLAHLEDPEQHRAEVDAAVRHLRDCPDCERRIGHLARALSSGEEDQLNCQECEEQLPDYLQAARDGQAGEVRWRRVAYHLETCPVCAATYAELSELAAFAFGERGAEPPSYPVPDVSFLHAGKTGSSPAPPIRWHLDDWGRLIIEFSAELLRAFQPPAYAPRSLKSDKSSRVLYQVALNKAVEDLAVTITAEEDPDDPSQCTVTVEVDIPSRGGWPHLADTQVIIKRGEGKLETQATDPFGKAVFEGIAAADVEGLVVEIRPHP
jgi:hypothetical protein